MGAASTFQAAFAGHVEQKEYTQLVDLATGQVSGIFYREMVTRNSKEQTFVFSGLNSTNAKTTTTQTVRDFDNTQYSVPMKSSVTDGSSGTKSFPTEEVSVTRRRLSPALWEVVVTRVGSEYYLNGTKIINGPSWAFG